MAQLNSNLILQAQQPQFESPVNNLAKFMQVQGLQQEGRLRDMQMQDAMDARTSKNKLAELYQSAVGADGQIDRNMLFKGAAERGLGAQIPALQKQFAEADEHRGKVDAQSWKLANERYGAFKTTLGALSQRQDLSKDMVMQAGEELVRAGIIPAAMYQQSLANMPDDPNALRARLRDGLASQMAPDKIFEVFAPKAEKFDTGQQIITRDMNPNSPTYGQNTGGAPLQKMQTPDSIASNETTRRGQNMVDSRAREATAAVLGKPFEVTGPDGKPMLVQQDKMGNIKPLEGYKPKAGSDGRKPMTAAQEAKYREEFAKDYQSANTNLSNMNEVLNSIDEVRSTPGLGGATGAMAYLPSLPGGKAAEAEVRLKNLEGKITQLGKAAAAQGGAVGPMAVQEWKIVRDMIAAIDPKKGKDAMLQQIDLIEQSVLGASERIKDTYSKQYSPDFDAYPQFQNLTVPKRGAKQPTASTPGRIRFDAQGNEIK